MSPDYADKLRDLGLLEAQIEEIQDLNDEYFTGSLGYASFHTDYPVDYVSELFEKYGAEFTDSQEHYLRTEGFIK